MKKKAADIAVRYLEKEGTRFVFGVPGGHLLSLYDAMYRSGELTPILTRHEQGAAYMACGYAMTSGKIGVCCGTVGPGATNLVSGVAAAYMDSVPILVITGQVGMNSLGKGSLQEAAGRGRTLNHAGLFRDITKMSTMEVSSHTIPFAVRRAVRVALSGRPGPVHLDLPADVMAGLTSDDIIAPDRYRSHRSPVPVPGDTARAIELFSKANRPVILAGAGLAYGRTPPEELIKLAERFGAPVATTLRAKGYFPEDHPLALGPVGLYGVKLANSYIRSNTDVMLSLGCSMHEFTTMCWDPAFAPSEALIQVDIDPEEIGKNYPVTVGAVCDAGEFVAAMLVGSGETVTPNEALENEKLGADYFTSSQMTSNDYPVKPQRLMKEVSDALPSGSFLFTDIGNSLAWAERDLQLRGTRLITLSGLAAMGSNTAAAIGGKLGRPDSTVVSLSGDGDFMMNGIEVATAVAHNIPVVWIVLNNGRLGMIRDLQTMSYQQRYIAHELGSTDFAAFSRTLGAEGVRVSEIGQLRSVIDDAIGRNRPTVIDVPIDPEEMPPPKFRMMALQRSLGLPDMQESMSWGAVKAVWRMFKER